MKWLLPLLLAACSVVPADEPRAPEPLIAALKVAWPKNRAIHLVFHGHSVPSGYPKTHRVKPFDSYPLLAIGLIQEACPHAVINAIVTLTGADGVRIDAPDEPLEIRAALIRRVAAEECVPVADVRAAWKGGVKQERLLSQANHPNLAGHEIAARTIARLFGVGPARRWKPALVLAESPDRELTDAEITGELGVPRRKVAMLKQSARHQTSCVAPATCTSAIAEA